MSSENTSVMVDSRRFLVNVFHPMLVSISLPNGFVTWKCLRLSLSIFAGLVACEPVSIKLWRGYSFHPFPVGERSKVIWWKVYRSKD